MAQTAIHDFTVDLHNHAAQYTLVKYVFCDHVPLTGFLQFANQLFLLLQHAKQPPGTASC